MHWKAATLGERAARGQACCAARRSPYGSSPCAASDHRLTPTRSRRSPAPSLAALPEPFAAHLAGVVLTVEDFADDALARRHGDRRSVRPDRPLPRPADRREKRRAFGHLARPHHPLPPRRSSTNGRRRARASSISSTTSWSTRSAIISAFSDDDMHALERSGVTALLRFDGVDLRSRRAAAVRRPRPGARAGRGAARHRPQRQRQVEPAPPRRRACCAPPPARSSAARSALADDALALDRELPLGRALGFWARLDGASPAKALDAMGLTPLADVPVRLLSTGQARARSPRAGHRVGRAACGCSTSRPTASMPTASRGSTPPSPRTARGRRGPRRIAPAAGRRLAHGWSSRHDARARRPRSAPRARRRRLAAGRLLPAGRDAGAVRGRPRRPPARPDRRRRAVDRGADRRPAADRAADRARPRRRRARPARAARPHRGSGRRGQDRSATG